MTSITISPKFIAPIAESRSLIRTVPKQHNGRLSQGDLSPGAETLPLPAAAAPRNLTVCLVDDDLSVLKATGRLLSFAGWKVELFADPVAFLRYAEVHHPKVVVLDIRMSPMDGLEVQTQLGRVSQATRIIIVTSKDDPFVRSRAMGAGASAFFLKPAGRQEFLASVRSAFAED
jgi:two-component system, LuxR family, response regulator FixJ